MDVETDMGLRAIEIDRSDVRWKDPVIPEGHAWVPFGLPRDFESTDVDGVQGVFARMLDDRGGDPTCELDEGTIRPLWEKL